MWAGFLWVVTGEHTYNRVLFSVGKIVASSFDRMEAIKSCRCSASSPGHPELPSPGQADFPVQVIGPHYFLALGACSILVPLPEPRNPIPAN